MFLCLKKEMVVNHASDFDKKRLTNIERISGEQRMLD